MAADFDSSVLSSLLAASERHFRERQAPAAHHLRVRCQSLYRSKSQVPPGSASFSIPTRFGLLLLFESLVLAKPAEPLPEVQSCLDFRPWAARSHSARQRRLRRLRRQATARRFAGLHPTRLVCLRKQLRSREPREEFAGELPPLP